MAHEDLTFNVIGVTMAYYDLTFNVIGATMAHEDLTFNVIGATMAHDDLTFNVIGATIESHSQNPPACLYKPRACSIKWNCLGGTYVASGCLSLAGAVGWQTASSPLLRTPRLC